MIRKGMEEKEWDLGIFPIPHSPFLCLHSSAKLGGGHGVGDRGIPDGVCATSLWRLHPLPA